MGDHYTFHRGWTANGDWRAQCICGCYEVIRSMPEPWVHSVDVEAECDRLVGTHHTDSRPGLSTAPPLPAPPAGPGGDA